MPLQTLVKQELGQDHALRPKIISQTLKHLKISYSSHLQTMKNQMMMIIVMNHLNFHHREVQMQMVIERVNKIIHMLLNLPKMPLIMVSDHHLQL
jgi:hypothetical protein